METESLKEVRAGYADFAVPLRSSGRGKLIQEGQIGARLADIPAVKFGVTSGKKIVDASDLDALPIWAWIPKLVILTSGQPGQKRQQVPKWRCSSIG